MDGWTYRRYDVRLETKGPTHVKTHSSGHQFRFFGASLSWLGCDALFVSSFSSLRVVMLPVWSYCFLCVFVSLCRCVVVLSVSSYCFLRVIELTISPFSSIRRRLHKLVSGKSTFPANFAQNGDHRIVGSVEMSQFSPCLSPDLNLKRDVSSAVCEVVRLIENLGSCSNYQNQLDYASSVRRNHFSLCQWPKHMEKFLT